MTAETQTAFAKRIGRAKSWVTALKATGRLVMTPEGLVDVEQSLARIERTGGGRPDVANRHKEERSGEPSSAKGKAGSLADAKARKEAALAEQEEIRLSRMRGDVISLEDADAAMRFIGGAVKAALDVLPDQVAPLVAPTTDLAEVHELLAQATRDAITRVGEEIGRQKRQLQEGAAA